jgi:DNA processing protein
MLSPLAAHLLLLRLPDTGTASYWQLMEIFPSPQELLELPARSLEPYFKRPAIDALAAYQANPQNSHSGRQLAADLAYLDKHPQVQCLLFDDSRYPRLLREIPKPPPMLFVRGNPDCLSLPQLAMVGSRSPSGGGNENAERFAAYLAGCGLAITSGLALGIDAAAHRGALSVGGITIAVMGTGIDRVYPSRHHQLAQAIVDAGGALVSEFPLGTSSHASHFPQRNRIISGLSGGTLVVEAAVQSGSLITAAYALQHNREVFAIPGSIHNPLARGCHQLIRQGATLVETAQDIVDQLSGLISYKRQELQESQLQDDLFSGKQATQPAAGTANNSHSPAVQDPLSAEEELLLNALGYDPLPLDLLAERIGEEVGALSAALIGLEIKGLVQQVGASYQRC